MYTNSFLGQRPEYLRLCKKLLRSLGWASCKQERMSSGPYKSNGSSSGQNYINQLRPPSTLILANVYCRADIYKQLLSIPLVAGASLIIPRLQSCQCFIHSNLCIGYSLIPYTILYTLYFRQPRVATATLTKTRNHQQEPSFD